MKRLMSTGSAAALISVLAGSGAFADVTAENVWGDWEAYMLSMGYTIDAESRSDSDGEIAFTGLSSMMNLPEGAGELTINLGDVTFREGGDGSVSVILPPQYTVHVIAREVDDYSDGADGGTDGKSSGATDTDTTTDAPSQDMVGEQVADVTITVDQTGTTIIATGTDAETVYNVVMPDMTASLTQLIVEGEVRQAVATVGFSGYSGHYQLTEGELTALTGSAMMEALNINVSASYPAGSEDFSFAATAANLAGTASMLLPQAFDPENMAVNLEAGMSVEASYTIGASTFNASGRDHNDTFALSGSTTGTEFGVTMANDGMGLSEAVSGLDFTISSNEIPFPELNFSADEIGFNFLMPVRATETPEDFELGIRVVNFEMMDTLWNMFDPASVLPRDGVTAIASLSGQANWFFEIMNPEEQMAMETSGQVPGELHSLTLSELTVSGVGAELTGNGDFTFDNSDTFTFDGMPKPTGAVDLQLVGGNGLMDRLIQMGLLPEEQAMGFRMMMGLFAVVGEGEDTLNSRLEINEQGHVMANGQRLQ